MKNTQNSLKIGIQIGDRYGIPIYNTGITDVFKALDDANSYLGEKFKDDTELTLVTNRRKRRRKINVSSRSL
jgi:hypothetical protein